MRGSGEERGSLWDIKDFGSIFREACDQGCSLVFGMRDLSRIHSEVTYHNQMVS